MAKGEWEKGVLNKRVEIIMINSFFYKGVIEEIFEDFIRINDEKEGSLLLPIAQIQKIRIIGGESD